MLRQFALICFLLSASIASAEEKKHTGDPFGVPLDSMPVRGYDKTLCNDKWNKCSSYDREQFDTKYPGSSLESLSFYPLSKDYKEPSSPRGDSMEGRYDSNYSGRGEAF